jgi:hypothetical protein
VAILEEGSGANYLRFTHVERFVPWGFLGLYAVFIAFALANMFFNKTVMGEFMFLSAAATTSKST